MANTSVVLENLVTVAQAASEDVFMRLHFYSDITTAIATIKGAGYFAAAGTATMGTKQLHKGDLVYCIASDKLTGILLTVSDSDAGTVINVVVS